MVRFVLLALIGSSTFLSAAPTRACWALTCSPGFLLPKGGMIPANAPALIWEPRGHTRFDEQSEADLQFTRVTAEGSEAIAFSLERANDHWLIVPESPLGAESSFHVEGKSTSCRASDMTEEPTIASFETSRESYALPSSLGTLQACAREIGFMELPNGGSCSSDQFAAQIPIAVELSEDAAPWFELLLFSTTVDGEPWTPIRRLGDNYAPGSSWLGHGVDLLYSRCGVDSDPGLTVGTHRVQMHASLPGTDITLSTNEIEVTISCDDVSPEEMTEASCDAAILPEPNEPTDEPEVMPMQSSCSLRSRSPHGWQLALIALCAFGYRKQGRSL